MTVDVKGMGIREYLGQGDYWLDPKSDAVFEVKSMNSDLRVRAARDLARMSTALISLAECEAVSQGDLAEALKLAGRTPRVWMVNSALYRALYPDVADPAALHVVPRPA
jgi:hypothetical protein